MAETFKSIKRFQFPVGRQRRFLSEAMTALNLSNQEVAKLLEVSVRTITDWKREKFLITRHAVLFLSERAKIKIPVGAKVQDQYWYASKGAVIGGKALIAKYGRIPGDPEKRLKNWRAWWNREGSTIIRALPMMQVKAIREPKFSVELAELVGILLGDGGIAKYQVVVTLNSETDKEYVIYVASLFKKLFGVTSGVHKVRGSLAINIAVSRSRLVKFCVEKLGLKIGNKVRQQVDIPQWVKNNKEFQIACVRGLVDTDGSIFTHRYRSNGKYYSYKKFDYTSVSQPLLHSAYEILKSNGLHPRPYRGKSLRIDSIADMKKYFEIFGTSNPKHLKRYLS